MTGPDAIILWISLGVLSACALLGGMIRVASRLGHGSTSDDGDEGADWSAEGGQSFHNGAGQ